MFFTFDSLRFESWASFYWRTFDRISDMPDVENTLPSLQYLAFLQCCDVSSMIRILNHIFALLSQL